MLDTWCKEAGEGVSWKFAPWTSPVTMHAITSIEDEKNPFWKIMRETIQKEEFGMKVEPCIFPAGTDSRSIREIGIPAFVSCYPFHCDCTINVTYLTALCA